MSSKHNWCSDCERTFKPRERRYPISAGLEILCQSCWERCQRQWYREWIGASLIPGALAGYEVVFDFPEPDVVLDESILAKVCSGELKLDDSHGQTLPLEMAPHLTCPHPTCPANNNQRAPGVVLETSIVDKSDK